MYFRFFYADGEASNIFCLGHAQQRMACGVQVIVRYHPSDDEENDERKYGPRICGDCYDAANYPDQKV